MSAKRRTYLVQDPHERDTIQFIETIGLYFGLRPVCFYTDAKARYYGEREFPVLTSDAVEASYDVSPGELESFSHLVADRYDVVAVLPCREDTIETAARLSAHLDLDWNSEETMLRFRDKHAQKAYLRTHHPSVRVPDSRLVRRPDDVWGDRVPARFVLKPNDGYGNQNIGIFTATDHDAVTEFLLERPDHTWILEEYIGGPELHVNGQVRSDGSVVVLAVFEYVRTEVNDYATVYRGEVQCATDHPLFDTVVEYAQRLLTATGLRRCPFHLEVKVDDRGPCVIDLGARLASEGGGRSWTRLHPNRPDAFAVAAHDYLFENSFAMEPVDFEYYDSVRTVLAYGISDADGVIGSLAGLADIEAMPEFVGWIVKPQVGDHLVVTRELRGTPYIVELCHQGDDEASRRLIEHVTATVRWNEAVSARTRLRGMATHIIRRARPKLSWITHRIGSWRPG